jgi:hypothetical protein
MDIITKEIKMKKLLIGLSVLASSLSFAGTMNQTEVSQLLLDGACKITCIKMVKSRHVDLDIGTLMSTYKDREQKAIYKDFIAMTREEIDKRIENVCTTQGQKTYIDTQKSNCVFVKN